MRVGVCAGMLLTKRIGRVPRRVRCTIGVRPQTRIKPLQIPSGFTGGAGTFAA